MYCASRRSRNGWSATSCSQLRNDLGVSSGRQHRVDPSLCCGQAELVQTGHLGRTPLDGAEIGQRRTPPEGFGLMKEAERLPRIVRGERSTSIGGERLEAVEIQLARRDPDSIPRPGVSIRPASSARSLLRVVLRPEVHGDEGLPLQRRQPVVYLEEVRALRAEAGRERLAGGAGRVLPGASIRSPGAGRASRPPRPTRRAGWRRLGFPQGTVDAGGPEAGRRGDLPERAPAGGRRRSLAALRLRRLEPERRRWRSRSRRSRRTRCRALGTLLPRHSMRAGGGQCSAS